MFSRLSFAITQNEKIYFSSQSLVVLYLIGIKSQDGHLGLGATSFIYLKHILGYHLEPSLLDYRV